MFDNYYDTVEYIEKKETVDDWGYKQKQEPRQIKVRCVTGGESFVIGKDDATIKFTKKYHVPFMVKQGDLIDGRMVINAEASKDVHGNFHFCIAKVE